MAQDDKPTAADKGKGKAVENGKPEDVPKDKDGKPLANGKKEDEKDESRSCACLPTLHTLRPPTNNVLCL